MPPGAIPKISTGVKDISPQQSHSYSMDRIRLESIEKRKQECSQIIKDRKRKLSELYCVARLPFVPISLDQVQHIEEKLMAFLEKNDLENGHTFDISYLSKDKIFRKSLSPQHQIHNQTELQKSNASSPDSPRSNSQPIEPLKKQKKLGSPVENTPVLKAPVVDEKVLSKVAKAKSTSPSPAALVDINRNIKTESSPELKEFTDDDFTKKPDNIELDNKLESSKMRIENPSTVSTQSLAQSTEIVGDRFKTNKIEPEKQQTDAQESTQIEEITKQKIVHVLKEPKPNEPPMLSEIISKYSNDLPLKRADEPSGRDLQYKDIDIKRLMIALMPEKKPHKVAEARSLTELYYQQQTLQLQKLLLRAHKTLNTQAFETALVEGKVSVLHSRIEELKRKNSWSLRQPRKFIDPFLKLGKKTHWDRLVSEAKWLATDFKEERRYKLVQCVYIAQAVQDYWSYGKVCCIKRAPIAHIEEKVENLQSNFEGSGNEMDVDQLPAEKLECENIGMAIASVGKPENENAEIFGDCEAENQENVNVEIVEKMTVIDEKDNEKDEINNDRKCVPPENQIYTSNNESKQRNKLEEGVTEIFNSVSVPKVEINDKILKEYEENGKTEPDFTYPNYEKDIAERFYPFNIYADMDFFTPIEKSVINNLPFYSPFDEKEQDHVVERELYGHVSAMLPPTDEEPQFEKILFRKIEDVDKRMHRSQNGLFGPYRRINILKPPKPPLITQLNIRIPTIWLPQDDKYLIKYVSEFSFNWDVISAHLSAKPMRNYTSNIERRTPWQCFERYIQLNDKFQFTDMRGMNAIDAKNWLEAAHQAQATTKRRISPLGVGIDSIQRGNRRLRWASMFEAMRKLMKKRESQQKPTPQPRKQNPDLKKSDTPTPEDLAKLKNDRDRALQESYAQQGRNQVYGRVRGPVSGRPIANDGRKAETKMANALASPQQGNGSHDVITNQVNNALPTTPGGSQLTPEQIQRFLQIQKQRQIAQRQKIMQSTEQGSSSPINGHPVLNQAISQPPLSNSNSQSNLASYNSPNSSNVYPVIAQSQRIVQSNMHSHSLNSSPQPQFNSVRANSPAVPTPEQVLQNAKLSGVSYAGSPTPPIKVGRAESPVGGIKKPIKQKFQLSHQQVSSIINQIQMKHPNLEKSQVTQLAGSYISRLQQANQMQFEKQQQKQQQNQQQNQQQQQQQQPMQMPSSQGVIPAMNTPPQQFTQTSVASSPTPTASVEKKNISSLSLEQLNALIKNPKLTDIQRKQLLVLRQRQLDQQQRLQAQLQGQISNQLAQPPSRSDSNRVNTSSITTRFSPQPGSSNSANLNYYAKSSTAPNANFASASNVGTPNVNDDATGADEFTDMSKIDELFGLNQRSNDK